jgi:hypothetical protein
MLQLALQATITIYYTDDAQHLMQEAQRILNPTTVLRAIVIDNSGIARIVLLKPTLILLMNHTLV